MVKRSNALAEHGKLGWLTSAALKRSVTVLN
jgi:hypothetical protein